MRHDPESFIDASDTTWEARLCRRIEASLAEAARIQDFDPAGAESLRQLVAKDRLVLNQGEFAA